MTESAPAAAPAHWKRNVTLFLTGQTVSLFGSMIVQYAVMWYVTFQTGSGLAIALYALAAFLPANDRVVLIEDTAELQLQQRHVVKFETRPPNLNKEGGINQRRSCARPVARSDARRGRRCRICRGAWRSSRLGCRE